jgi:myosin heavy subunit
METLYAWLVLLAGATAGVLGMLLLASERELRSIRREVEKLRSRQTGNSIDRSRPAERAETDSSADLMTRNKELAEKIYSLSSRLEESQKMVDELQNQQQRLVGAQSENQELYMENRQLQQEIADLRNRLESTNALLGTSGSQYDDLAERQFQLQSELAQLSQQIDKLTAKNNDQREQIDSLLSKLAASEKKIEDLQTLQQHTQSDNQQLRASNRELQQEIAHISQQLQPSEARLSESAKQNVEAAAGHARLQSEIADLTRQLEESRLQARQLEAAQRPPDDVESGEMIFRDPQHKLEAQSVEMQRELSAGEEKVQHHGNAIHPGSNDLGARIQAANEEAIQPAARTLAKQRWSIGIVTAAVGVLAVGGALAVSFLGTNSDDLFVSKEPAAAFETVWDQPPAETTPKRSKRTGSGSMAASENEFAKQKSGPQPAPRLQGAFKTTRPTEVYSRPSKNSSLIANIGPGMKLNVVDSHDGWLEIRSKHGRPPGFVRQEAAVRID